MLTFNSSELLPCVLASAKAQRITAANYKLKAPQIRVLVALSVACESWPCHITPGEFAKTGILSRNQLRAHCRALILAGFVTRSRDEQGHQVLKMSSKGKGLVWEHVYDLRRAARAYK